MQTIIEKSLNGLKLGEPTHFGRMSVYPIFTSSEAQLQYVMLRKAFQHGWIRVTEITEGGSVPELKLYNESETPVLLLDGEELEGAKQNRVLNTTLLVLGKSRLVVPVSCTEQGRWSRVSPEFRDSERVMFKKAREAKMESVHQSLKRGAGHHSDQGQVWDEIGDVQMKFACNSPTSAMKDVYDTQQRNIEEYLAAFPLNEGQCGFISGLDGRVAGLEFISRPEGYTEVHRQLVESYALDALLETGRESDLSLDGAQRFLEQIWSARAESFPSAASGTDVRLESDEIIGSALVEKEEVIHLSAFARRSERAEKFPRMASYRRRRAHQRS